VVSAAVGPALAAVAHGVINLSIALLGLFFLLATGTAGWDAVKRRLPFTPAGSDELRDVFTNATRATILGTLASAALQGTSIGIGLRLIGNSAPAVWGAVAGFATLIPVVGNAVVWVPAVVVPLIQRQYGSALVMLALGKLIPAVIDRVVRSGISRRLANLHPMVTLVGVMLGARLFGAAGVLVGPALAQTGIALAGLFEREYGLWWTIPDAGGESAP
jgi:predicted PurR-regulated permease PerM